MKYLIALICLGLPAYLIRFSILGIPTTLLESIVYAVFIIGVYYKFKKGDTNSKSINSPDKITWYIVGLFLIAGVVSTAIAPDKTVALGQLKAFFIDPVLVFYLITNFVTIKDIKWIIYGLAGSSLIVSGYSIWQKITGQVTADNRVIGIFGYSPNYVALFLAPIIVLMASYLLINWRIHRANDENIQLLSISTLVIINFYALILSGSRGGELAVLGGAMIFLICYNWNFIREKLWRKLALMAIIAVVIVSSWFLFRPDFSAGGRTASSNNVRWQIWQTSIEIMGQHPVLGVGLGNFQNYFSNLTQHRMNFPEYISPVAVTPHNIFLMFYITTGILGLVAFVAIILLFYRTCFFNFKNNWSIILIVSMSTLLLQGLVDAPYFKNDLSMLFWIIIALAFALVSRDNQANN